MNAFTPGLFTITPPKADKLYRVNGLQAPVHAKNAITVTNQAQGQKDAHRRDSIKRSLSSKETK